MRMTNSFSPSIDASRRQLAQLTLIRNILLGVLWVSFILALEIEQLKTSSEYLLRMLLVFSTVHVLTFVRLKNSLPVTEFEFLR